MGPKRGAKPEQNPPVGQFDDIQNLPTLTVIFCYQVFVMPAARHAFINLTQTPYYHCMSRCVRRAHLCGKDTAAGKVYEHRRGWVERRLLLLSEVFSIRVMTYAIMSNHFHLAVKIESHKPSAWGVDEVISRWHRLFKGTLLTRRYCNYQQREQMSLAQRQTVEHIAAVWRARLADISWFMRSLNEYIARKANKEDKCTGRFWEGRFKCQPLLSDAALIACMAYIDLNPVRAKMVRYAEQAKYTGFSRRAGCFKLGRATTLLMPFFERGRDRLNTIPCRFSDYQQLIRLLTANTLTSAPDAKLSVPEPVSQLGIKPQCWQLLTSRFEALFHGAVGTEAELADFCKAQRKQKVRSRSIARQIFHPATA